MLRVAKMRGGGRIEKNRYNTTQKIKQYGDNNSYPQDIRDFINASRTAKSCLNVFAKFVKGSGFTFAPLNDIIVRKRLTLFKLHGQIVSDFSKHEGFAIHVNYNGFLDEVNYSLVPFEMCRLEVDSNKDLTGRIAVHPDWTGENGKPFKASDIDYFDQYTSDKEAIRDLIAGNKNGFSDFKGLVYYFTKDVETYPLSPLDAVRELMVAQVSSDSIRVRNTKFNFLPAGILYRKEATVYANSEGTTEDVKREEDTFAKDMEAWQGDENAAKIVVIEGTGAAEDEMKFVPFPVLNLDKFTESTDKACIDGIRSFMGIPPELLGIAGARGFAAETMRDAYDFYNSVTESERTTLEDAYAEVFANLFAKNGVSNVQIAPLKYLASKSTETPPTV